MIPESFYHIYNRGNNKETIFFEKRNSEFFLEKAQRHLLPHLDILAFCLMKNHFHFLVYSKEDLIKENFSDDLKIMLRSYTRAINKQEKRTGSLFQQHTKVKSLDSDNDPRTPQITNDYPLNCFHYIHQNPIKARLVKKMEDYEMSSFRDYIDLSRESFCNRELAMELLDLPKTAEEFRKESYLRIDDEESRYYVEF